jgi:hypothetical protein
MLKTPRLSPLVRSIAETIAISMMGLPYASLPADAQKSVAKAAQAVRDFYLSTTP